MSEKDTGYRHRPHPSSSSSSSSSSRPQSMGRHQRFLPPELLTDLHLANLLPGMLTTDHVSGLDDLRRVAVHNHFLRNELALLHQLPLPGQSQLNPRQQEGSTARDARKEKGRYSNRNKHYRSYSSQDFPKMSSSDYVNLTDCYEHPQDDTHDKGNRSLPYMPSGYDAQDRGNRSLPYVPSGYDAQDRGNRSLPYMPSGYDAQDRGNRSLPYVPSGYDAQDRGNRSLPYMPSGYDTQDRGNRSLSYMPSGQGTFPCYSVTHDVRYDLSDDEDYGDVMPEELDIDELLSEGLGEGLSDTVSLSPVPESSCRLDKNVTSTSRRRHVNAARRQEHR